MEITRRAEDFVVELFASKEHELLLFHSLAKIKQIVEWVCDIAEFEKLTKEQTEVATVAAWFLYTGYLFDYLHHRTNSLKNVEDFFEANPEFKKDTAKVLSTLESVSRNNVHPSIEARVLSDASTYFLAADDFLLAVKYNRQERNYFVKPKINKRSFFQNTLNYLNEHEFHTDYGKGKFEKGKLKNIARIKAIMASQLQDELPQNNRELIEEMRQELKKINQKVEKRIVSTRGYDSLYRITGRNQITLSGIADNKANILITLNTLIVSAVITFVLVRIDEFEYLLFPTIITILFSLASIAFAVVSASPQLRPGTFSKEAFLKKQESLIFYGNFYKMDYQDYEDAIRAMITDQELLFSNLSRDQFALGKILGRKFKQLNMSFTIFLIGITFSSLSFIITILLNRY